MSKIKKSVSLILSLILGCMFLAFISGCTGKTDSQDDSGTVYLVYYCNAQANDIIYQSYTGISAASSSYDKIEILFDRMFNYAEEYEGCYSVKFGDVEVEDYNIDSDGILTIDFSEEYYDLTNVQEIILRASVVLTMIQVEGVDGVTFTVSGESALDVFGDEIGIMTDDTFVGVLLTEEGMLEQKSDVIIYFTNEDGTELVPVTEEFTTSSSNLSMEEYILQRLIEGPADSSLYRTLADTVEVLSVTTTDNICYVNFSSSFTEQSQEVGDEIMIYSIVNSLCRLSYVSSVQFLIEGESNITLHSVFDLSQPIQRNRDLEQS